MSPPSTTPSGSVRCPSPRSDFLDNSHHRQPSRVREPGHPLCLTIEIVPLLVGTDAGVHRSSTDEGMLRVGYHHMPRVGLPDTFFGVHDPQRVGDLGTHYHFGKVAERRDELRPVRRLGVAEVVGDFV